MKLSNYKKDDRYHLSYSITDFSKEYVKEYKKGLDRQTYKKAILLFFKYLAYEIIVNVYHFKMPHKLGILKIKKAKNRNTKYMDMKTTMDIGKKVYFANLHTDGFYFKWAWEKTQRHALFTNKGFYRFRPVRRIKKFMSEHIKKCASDPNIRDYDVYES